ncbi:MAG: hypothetical protein JXA15_01995 [Spirochaetales bacterium]|nr:hypothetical protein [Spirochaetales bacterium]
MVAGIEASSPLPLAALGIAAVLSCASMACSRTAPGESYPPPAPSIEPYHEPPLAVFDDGFRVLRSDFPGRGYPTVLGAGEARRSPDEGAERFDRPAGEYVLFLEDPDSDWLRFVARDGSSHGWLDVRGIAVGDSVPEYLARSDPGGRFRAALARESGLLAPGSPFRRYGPLLVVGGPDREVRIWDRFAGEGGSRRLLLVDRPLDGLLTFFWRTYGESGFLLYDLELGELATLAGFPIFNVDASACYSYERQPNGGVLLELLARDGEEWVCLIDLFLDEGFEPARLEPVWTDDGRALAIRIDSGVPVFIDLDDEALFEAARNYGIGDSSLETLYELIAAAYPEAFAGP